MHVEIIWSGDEQHITFVASQSTISATSAAAALRWEYITIFDLFINDSLAYVANEKCAKC